jgi:putative SbcD/Mre11-related phosphoesterase
VVLDARRALFLSEAATLVVADLHLGYAWVQRQRGALLPVAGPPSTLDRLSQLLDVYQPRRLVILGDLVHRAVALPALESELHSLAQRLPPSVEWTVCTGNHDQGLASLLGTRIRTPAPQLVAQWSTGRFRLHHGDREVERSGSLVLAPEDPVDMIGHEHPAVRLGDGVATQAKVPCFLRAHDVWVLPAFSDWAAGCEVGRQPFLGPVARRARFHTAFACLGPRILKIPLQSR